MISKKILYSEQLLQLVLALSLLQVDPVNYLEWGVSRIHSNDHGSPWQLEVAHTPFSEYPYMNRKTYVPLIEDLARYDHIRSHDVQAYLLNVSDDPPSFITTLNANSNNNNNIDNDSNISNMSSGNLTTTSGNATTATHDSRNNRNNNNSTEDSASAMNFVNMIQDIIFQENPNAEDVFLQSELFSSNSESIIEQNLADLNDYSDHHQYLAMPTKNDPWLELYEESSSGTSNEGQQNLSNNENSVDMRELRLNNSTPPTTFTRSAIIDWHDYLPLLNGSSSENENVAKKEESKNNTTNVEMTVGISDLAKREDDTSDDVGDEKNEPAITSNVELTIEVSRNRKITIYKLKMKFHNFLLTKGNLFASTCVLLSFC
jgi:hypothetical protein